MPQNDLNSVLLEGEIHAITPALEANESATSILIRNKRRKNLETEEIQYSFVKADVSALPPAQKHELIIGRHIRIVGRILAPYRKGVTLATEHIEFKPMPAQLRT